jgi:hypothetical protein
MLMIQRALSAVLSIKWAIRLHIRDD